ncbi:MAG: transposase [Xenococcaceae cyanobacterium MO_167.B27]|nr:transposase [Xenococcaceae cyanobacterium MO_167.B27]
MFVLEYKIKAKQHQYRAIDSAIRTGKFVRNKALRYWLDNKGVNKYDLNKYCRVIAKEYSFANELNSTARQVKNLVRNSKLSKSINDAGWTQFRRWIEYMAWKMGKITIAVPPQYTSQECPSCGKRVKKSLSTRTHICSCGYTEDRDIAASIRILQKGLCTAGHVGTYASTADGVPSAGNWRYATGDLPSWSVGASLLANGESMNVESPTKIIDEAIGKLII